MVDLENKVRTAIIEGQPLSHRPWKKILIIVEGVYRYVCFQCFECHLFLMFNEISQV